MIPIDVPFMVLGYMLAVFSDVFLVLLIACAFAWLIPRSRNYLRARPIRVGLLMVGLAIGSLPSVSFSYRHWQDWRAQNPRLQQEEVLGDLVLPAGTRVHLRQVEPMNDLAGKPIVHGLPSLDQAEFTRTPGLVKGLRVRSLKLSDFTATLDTLDAHTLESWQCAPGTVEYDFPSGAQFNFAQCRLRECWLAPGASLGGIVWPGPVRVFATESGWEARSEDTIVTVHGLPLRWLSLRISQPYAKAGTWTGHLTEPADFGTVHYPQGIPVRRQGDQLWFSLPEDEQAEDRRTGTLIDGGHTVVQGLDGAMIGVETNDALGIHFFDRIIVP